MGTVLSEKEEKRVINVVEYYCDRCGKFLGESEECDDGYIPIPNSVNKTDGELRLFGTTFKVPSLMLCDECYISTIKSIENSIATNIANTILYGNRRGNDRCTGR